MLQKQYQRGALDTSLKIFVSASVAVKKPEKDAYRCIDTKCNEPVILCKGKKNIHHFRHNCNSKCQKYNKKKLNENDIHNDAQHYLRYLLETQEIIKIEKKCVKCDCHISFHKPLELTEKSNIFMEYPLKHDGRTIRADVAHVINETVVELYEILNTHKTDEINRPKNIDWYEFDCNEILDILYNPLKNKSLRCHRKITCECCLKSQLFLEEKNKMLDQANFITYCERSHSKGTLTSYPEVVFYPKIEPKKIYKLNINKDVKDKYKPYGAKWDAEKYTWYWEGHIEDMPPELTLKRRDFEIYKTNITFNEKDEYKKNYCIKWDNVKRYWYWEGHKEDAPQQLLKRIIKTST